MMLIKILITILLLGLTGCVSEQLAGADNKINSKISNIQSLQQSDKQQNGKYKERPAETVDGITYKVDEYENPQHEIGYIITIKKTEGDKVYMKATATGKDAANYQYDWRLVETISATSTK